MIRVLAKPGFFAGQFLEMSLSRLGATLLEALAQGCMTQALVLDLRTAEGLARRIGGQIENAQIDSQRSYGFISSGFRNIQGHSQVPRSLAIEQISLSLDAIESRLLVITDTEGNQHAPLQ